MVLRLSPLAVAISSALILSANAWADGGVSGNPGDIFTFNPGLISVGAPGSNGANARGADGASFANLGSFALQQGVIATVLGQNGGDAGNPDPNIDLNGGGGVGGAGGGSVFVAMSIGGAGGGSSSIGTTNGGHGGAVSGISLGYSGSTTLTFSGTAGGRGGQGGPFNTSAFETEGAGGAGGAGGGSIFAAFSQGGAAGGTLAPASDVFADGGDGGDISAISVDLINLNLIGDSGGRGGRAALNTGTSDGEGGGGAGGVGGGSVFAAFSRGGAGGYVDDQVFNLVAVSSSRGGAGGAISAINLKLNNLQLDGGLGGAGGQGGEATGTAIRGGDGGGGSGGAGGGSVFAAFSQGGAGGLVNSSSYEVKAVGGAGGIVSNITLNMSQISLKGGSAGAGGAGGASLGATSSGASSGGGAGGAGGAGGGSIFAAFSQGGAGGRTFANKDNISAGGGAGGGISGVVLALNQVNLSGGLGGVGGRGGVSSASSAQGAGGDGGVGGGSIFAAFSNGGGGGGAARDAIGGTGGDISDVELSLSQAVLTGAQGGEGGQSSNGARGAGGAGGGSVFGASSQGGGGGLSVSRNDGGSGGDGGAISTVNLRLSGLLLTGAQGGTGGQGPTDITAYSTASGGAGGVGGGSVIAAFSQGGAGGSPTFSNGGSGGALSMISLSLADSTLNGAQGGAGGQAGSASAGSIEDPTGGAGGIGGVGGGSVLGAFSQGGTGGGGLVSGFSSVENGGSGGDISAVSLSLTNVTLNGAQGGAGGQAATGSGLGAGIGGAGGAGGGSIFAGFSQGGAGGTAFSVASSASSANGAGGGNVGGNQINLTDVRLFGAAGGAAGTVLVGGPLSLGFSGNKGVDGGSIFGGYSAGGAGGYLFHSDSTAQVSAAGGDGGDSSSNVIRLAGQSSLTGHIFGGYSQGGNAGHIGFGSDYLAAPETLTSGSRGLGGEAINNTITLVGPNLTIGGSVYGGFSIDGDVDFATQGYSSLNNAKTFTGNTLNLEGYRGSVEGVYNFENYNWTLPADVVNRDVIIEIRGNDLVDLNNTKHTVAMLGGGNRLNENDEVVLISKAQGDHQPKRTEVQQGYFILYDALLEVNSNDEFVLRIAGKDDNTPNPVPRDLEPVAGRLNPTAKALLQGRAAALAMVNQGADMISEQLTECTTDVFAIGEGGSSRYNTGSSVKVSDQRLAIGGRKCFELPDNSRLMLGAFAEHGTGNYHSRNHFEGVGKVRGHGDLRYTGGGLMLHMDYAGTGTGVAVAPVLASKDGLYNDVVLRAGHIKTDFASNQLIDASGKRAEYKSKSHYASAMLGAGYAWNLDSQQQVDLYGRYTWDRLASDKVKIGGDEVRFATDRSSRLRIGTRYNYAVTSAIAPYAGIAYEHEFDGKASGKVFEFDIDSPELKGSSGVLEVGVKTHPFGNDSRWQFDAGVQGYFGTRKGATGSLSVKYEF